jgi:hypothetical protein
VPTLPLPLLTRLSAENAVPVAAWWDALSEADRSELLTLWDRRGNDCRFSLEIDGGDPPVWHRLPLVDAVFTDEAEPGDDWVPEWTDHLLSNPEVWVWAAHRVVVMRTFHICTAHPAARAVLRAGFIPAAFACPLASAECPMRKLLKLAPGRSIRLRLVSAEVPDAGQESPP